MDAGYQILTFLLVILFCGAFCKVLITLNILRLGLGMEGGVFAIPIVILAVLLSATALSVQYPSVFTVENSNSSIPHGVPGLYAAIEREFRPALMKRVDNALVRKIMIILGSSKENVKNKTQPSRAGQAKSAGQDEGSSPPSEPATNNENLGSTGGGDLSSTPFSVLLLASLVGDLRVALQLGLVMYVPFFVIDLLVVNLLMVLSVTQVSQRMISLPLKLVLFMSVDGWTLVTEKLFSMAVG